MSSLGQINQRSKAKLYCQRLYTKVLNSIYFYDETPYTKEENEFARNYVSFLIVKQFAKGKSKTPPRKAKPENDLSSYFHIKKRQASIDQIKDLSVSINRCSSDIAQFYSKCVELKNEIDEEDSLSPAVVRMTNRIFRNLKYNYSVTSTEKSIEVPPPSLSLTNSMVYEVGNDLCEDAFGDFISKYSSTIVSILPLNIVKAIDLPSEQLQIKSIAAKNALFRGLQTGYLNLLDKINSIHYSNK